jgi:hypothetical protein
MTSIKGISSRPIVFSKLTFFKSTSTLPSHTLPNDELTSGGEMEQTESREAKV